MLALANYGLNQTVDITTQWQEHTITFIASGFHGVVDDARFRFFLGVGAQAGDEIWVDNVTLTQGVQGTPVPTVPQATTQPTATTTACKLADLDCSGKVNAADLTILLSKFGTNDPMADLDKSGKVNAADLSILLANFGK